MMMEVLDRLACAFGQDALDSLYWTTRLSPKAFVRVGFFFAVTLLYVVGHALLLFIHLTTINVAMNSSDQGLMTLLISNNFNEIKMSVFKKFDTKNLFQLACSDIVERFKLGLFMLLLLALNVCQSPEPFKALSSTGYQIGFVLSGEFLADWLKHAFITKFNHMSPTVYADYAVAISHEIVACRRERTVLDHTHAVSRKLGLAQAWRRRRWHGGVRRRRHGMRRRLHGMRRRRHGVRRRWHGVRRRLHGMRRRRHGMRRRWHGVRRRWHGVRRRWYDDVRWTVGRSEDSACAGYRTSSHVISRVWCRCCCCVRRGGGVVASQVVMSAGVTAGW